VSQILEPPNTNSPRTAGDAILEELKPPPNAHALVIGHNTLDTLCGLIRRGCAEAAELRPDDHGPAPDSVEIAVLPDPASLAEASASVKIARRALTGGGRIAIRDATGRYQRELVSLLRAQGFVSVCTRYGSGNVLVLGQRPVLDACA
jgi:hypothetical protein